MKFFRSTLFPLSLPLFFLSLVLLSSCLSDPIDGPEVRPSLVGGPLGLTAYATNFQAPDYADMVVHWGHSITDTQLNFSGYYVRIYASQRDSATQTDVNLQFIQSVLVPKVGNRADTIVTIPHLHAGEYTIQVNGEQTADTLRLSSDTSTYSFYLDARPLENPTNLVATSTRPNQVTLHWDLPSTDTLGSMLGYAIYYRDSDITAVQKLDTAQLASPTLIHSGVNSVLISLPVPANANDVNPQQEHKYQMWVKAVRSDQQQFYQDSSMTVWSGAERVSNDSVRHSILFSASAGTGFALIDDSLDAAGQIGVDLSSGSINLTAKNGGSFLNKIDNAISLDSIFYKYPYTTNFTLSTMTIPNQTTPVILYYQFPDAVLTSKYDYARILIRPDSTGASLISGGHSIHVEASWQHGTNRSGSDILPYY